MKHVKGLAVSTTIGEKTGKLSDLMFGRVIFLKYLDPGIPVVDVPINEIIVPNTLVDLGAAINVMTKETMLKLNLQGDLRKTTTVLELADRSTVAPKVIVENVIASFESSKYLTYFLVLQSKTKFNGYSLILRRPCLAIANAYISCRGGNLTIKNGHLSKQMVLYPHAHVCMHEPFSGITHS